MDENKEFTISFATLFELLRIEKDREELQKLDKNFFEDVQSYIKDKKIILSQDTLNNLENKRKAEKELDNLKKILHELYAKREKKIVNMALDKSRIKTNIVDTAAMLSQEKELFDLLVSLLDDKRDCIIANIFDETTKEEKTEVKEEQKEEKSEFKAADEIKPTIENTEKKEEPENETKLVRFIHAVPKFVGKELEDYGPFEEEDVANLPTEIAQVLIDKGRAEEINQ